MPHLNILFDRSVSIRDSVQDVKFTLLLTVGLVVMVIFLFLRNLSATIIPSLAGKRFRIFRRKSAAAHN